MFLLYILNFRYYWIIFIFESFFIWGVLFLLTFLWDCYLLRLIEKILNWCLGININALIMKNHGFDFSLWFYEIFHEFHTFFFMLFCRSGSIHFIKSEISIFHSSYKYSLQFVSFLLTKIKVTFVVIIWSNNKIYIT